MVSVNSVSVASCPKLSFKQNPQAIIGESDRRRLMGDSFDSVSLGEVSVPKISKTRLFFSRLTDEQIAEVNNAGKLPEGAKFCRNAVGGYDVCNNFFNLRAGTQTIPAGYELKKDILGFTIVVPKDTKGAFIRG